MNMKLASIIEVILRTPELEGKTIALAAHVARSGKADAVDDVAKFWIDQGGIVDDWHTADSLTDEQIDQVRNEALDADDDVTAHICTIALGRMSGSRAARIDIARHLNAAAVRGV